VVKEETLVEQLHVKKDILFVLFVTQVVPHVLCVEKGYISKYILELTHCLLYQWKSAISSVTFLLPAAL